MPQVGADERAHRYQAEVPSANILQRAFHQARRQAAAFERRGNLRVDQHQRARLCPIGDHAGSVGAEPQLVAMMIGIVHDSNGVSHGAIVAYPIAGVEELAV